MEPHRWAAFALALAPALALMPLAAAVSGRRWRDEFLWTAAGLGAASAILGALLAWPGTILAKAMADPARAALANAFFGAGLAEEAAKLAIVLGAALRHYEADRPGDPFTVAVAVALGFAGFENLFYVIEAEKWHATAVVRALTAVPMHGLQGCLMGALLLAGRRAEALLWPMLLHAAYDWPLMAAESMPADRAAWTGLWLGVMLVAGGTGFAATRAALRLVGGPPAAPRALRRGGLALTILALLMGPGLAALTTLAGPPDWTAIFSAISAAVLPATLGLILWTLPQRQMAQAAPADRLAS
ncbi:MAG TPA: PrsW family glutamic-type intramembrane protease [Alphaproteobacteria bacterium]|nr:PrsW family glutamic-type intramembrane protease [Alphaproteobacteria bacterium]